LESDSLLLIIIFVILLLLSAFFSGSETAFFSLTKVVRNRLKDKNTKRSNRVLYLLQDPRKLLITILTGNTIVNVSAAGIAAFLAANWSRKINFPEELAIIIEVVVVTIILLVLSEITPKIFSVKNAIQVAELTSLPIQLIAYILYPITKLLSQFPIIISKIMASRSDRHLLTKEELKTLIEVGEEKGTLVEEEKEMIHSIFEFTKTSVREIMIPRIDMVCVEENIRFSELVQVINEKGHTRIPVFKGRVDEIIGILHAKELLPLIKTKPEQINLRSLVRPALFVPECKMLDELMKDFHREKVHMAIVVDEYGGTAGLITLEDVIEEIVGEIQDEYDTEKPLFKVQEDKTILVNAKIDIDELNDKLQLNLPTDANYESLGGFILNLTGSVPNQKDEIFYQGYKFVIEKTERNRIVQVSIHKIAENQQKIS